MAASPAARRPAERPLGIVAASWGAAGLVALLAYAIQRLAGVVAQGLEHSWAWPHVAVAVVNALFMAWSEGYRGFQQAFSPRSAARVKWLAQHASPGQALLAPLFVMGYFGATRRRMAGVYLLTGFVVVAIVVIHYLPQPWRAALDVGVVIGLAWGLVSFLVALWRTLSAERFLVSPEVDEPSRRAASA